MKQKHVFILIAVLLAVAVAVLAIKAKQDNRLASLTSLAAYTGAPSALELPTYEQAMAMPESSNFKTQPPFLYGTRSFLRPAFSGEITVPVGTRLLLLVTNTPRGELCQVTGTVGGKSIPVRYLDYYPSSFGWQLFRTDRLETKEDSNFTVQCRNGTSALRVFKSIPEASTVQCFEDSNTFPAYFIDDCLQFNSRTFSFMAVGGNGFFNNFGVPASIKIYLDGTEVKNCSGGVFFCQYLANIAGWQAGVQHQFEARAFTSNGKELGTELARVATKARLEAASTVPIVLNVPFSLSMGRIASGVLNGRGLRLTLNSCSTALPGFVTLSPVVAGRPASIWDTFNLLVGDSRGVQLEILPDIRLRALSRSGCQVVFIAEPAPYTLSIVAPNGGESLQIGKSYPVSFNIAGTIPPDSQSLVPFVLFDRINPDGSPTNGGFITRGLPLKAGLTTVTWTVIPLSIVPASNYKVRVELFDPSNPNISTFAKDSSDNFFSITLPAGGGGGGGGGGIGGSGGGSSSK